MHFQKSFQLFERARHLIPGGVNSPVRAFKSVDLSPLFISHGKGSRLYDVDGNSFIDYVGSWGPLILGHAHEGVLEEIKNALARGTSFGAPTEAEIEMAEEIQHAFPSIEMLRLVNSGTEAAMGAIRAARGYTGRKKIIKFEGCYHGSVDYLLVKAGSGATTLGTPDSKGVPEEFVELTLLASFNDLESVREQLENNRDEIAAILVEPIAGNMGMVMPQPGFLQGLRQLCDREGIVLIFDEVMTGFRVDFGGAQALYQIESDLTLFGKVVGGGLPVGGYGGRREIMEYVAPAGPVYQAGTLSGNPIAVAAGLATLRILKNPEIYIELNQKSLFLANAFKTHFTQANLPIQVNQVGGMLGFFLSTNVVHHYEDALKTNVALFKIFLNRCCPVEFI